MSEDVSGLGRGGLRRPRVREELRWHVAHRRLLALYQVATTRRRRFIGQSAVSAEQATFRRASQVLPLWEPS